MDSIDPVRMKRLRLLIETSDPLFTGLRKLKLKGKDLARIPNEIFQMTDLEVLDLSPERESCLVYRIEEVPSSIGRLLNLRILMLDTSELSYLPPEICILAGLEKLSISNNLLTSLPDGFMNLTSLTSLHAANNRFIQFPQCLCQLPSLQFLDLSDNSIQSLPPAIGELVTLETLLLFINSLTSLPDQICKLTELRCLWLGKNKLKRLPRDFGKLKNLDWGRAYHTGSTAIDDNPLQLPPIQVCKRGVGAIEQYFKHAEA